MPAQPPDVLGIVAVVLLGLLVWVVVGLALALVIGRVIALADRRRAAEVAHLRRRTRLREQRGTAPEAGRDPVPVRRTRRTGP